MYKINLFLIGLFTFLNTDFTAQEKVKLPTKNDMVYYRETYTGLDAAKCIITYRQQFSSYSRASKIMIKDSLYRARGYRNISDAKHPRRFDFDIDNNSKWQSSGRNQNCIDTLSITVKITYPNHNTIGNGIVLFETIRAIQQASGVKREIYNAFSFDLYIYTLDKNTIEVATKNYKYMAEIQRENQYSEREIIPMEDNYKKYLENDKPKNHQHKFYEDVNFFTKRVFALIYSDLKRAIQTTDL